MIFMNNKQVAKLLKTLGGNVRLNIVLYLSSGEKCVCDIFEYLKLPQNLVSHHLSVMRKNNLITARRDGKWVYYTLNNESIKKLNSFLFEILQTKKRRNRC